MYTTSKEYKNANVEPIRQFESEILIGSRKLTNEDLISFTINQSIQQDETFSIGNTISSCLNLLFLHDDIETDDKDIVDIKLGMLVNETYEYIPLGIYNIHSIDSNDTITTLICYDNMVKFDIAYSENNENPTLYTVINRLVELTGVKFGGTLSNYKDYKLASLKGYSCREILGFIAGVLGSNAIINREGKFDFISLSTQPIYAIERFELVTKDGSVVMTKDSEVVEVKAQVGYVKADNYYDYTKKNKNYKIKKVINSSDIGEISLGSIDDNSVCLSMQNPLINEEIIQDIYSKMNGLEFLPYSLNWSGDISIDLGDLITITDSKGVMRCHPVLSQTITYNGALNSILSAQGDTKLANTYTVKTKEEAELDRTQEDVKEVIDEVSGVKVEINKLQDSIELKVEKDELSTILTQNAESFGLSINGKLKGTNYNFDGDNFTIGDSSGDTTAYHSPARSKWQHSDGSYTQISSEGLMRYVSGEGKLYHSLIATGKVRVAYGRPDIAPEEVEVTLPDAFKGKTWKVTLSVSGCGYGSVSGDSTIYFMSAYSTGYSSGGYSTGKFSIYGTAEYRNANNKLMEGYLDISYTVVA